MVAYCTPPRTTCSTRGVRGSATSSTQKPVVPGARVMLYDSTSTRVKSRYSTSTGSFAHGSRVLADASTNRSSGPMSTPSLDRSGARRAGADPAGRTRIMSESVA